MSLLSQFYPAGGGSNTLVAEIALVAGGGGGGQGTVSNPYWVRSDGGGGGGGRVDLGFINIVLDQTYTVTIGAGGASSSVGNISTFGISNPITLSVVPTSQITFRGGAPGAPGGAGTPSPYSSGGGAASLTPVSVLGGQASTNYYIYNKIISQIDDLQGFANPGNGNPGPEPAKGGGGAGGTVNPISTQFGGPGLAINIEGSPVTYASGGAGGQSPLSPEPANSGNGASGSINFGGITPGQQPAAAGGSGVVIIAYPDSYNAATVTGTHSTPSRTGFRVYKFTGSGTFKIPS